MMNQEKSKNVSRVVNMTLASGAVCQIIPQKLLNIIDTNIYILYFKQNISDENNNLAVLEKRNDVFFKRPLLDYEFLDLYGDKFNYKNVPLSDIKNDIECYKATRIESLIYRNYLGTIPVDSKTKKRVKA